MVTRIGERPGRKVSSELRLGVLGPLTVTEGTTALHIGGPKQRTVLAMLIAHAADPVSVDFIVEAVWGEDAAPTSRRIVQTYVATLRSELASQLLDFDEDELGGLERGEADDDVDGAPVGVGLGRLLRSHFIR